MSDPTVPRSHLEKVDTTSATSVREVLLACVGRRVEIVLKQGQQMKGRLGPIADPGAAWRSIRLEQLEGLDYFDAVLDVEQVAGVIFRSR